MWIRLKQWTGSSLPIVVDGAAAAGDDVASFAAIAVDLNAAVAPAKLAYVAGGFAVVVRLLSNSVAHCHAAIWLD